MSDYSPSGMTRWDVYRDKDGNAVTLTEDQCAAVKHAARVWAEVAAAEGYDYTAPAELHALLNGAMVAKSCLLGRMLHEGRPPMDVAPPVVNAAPAYWQVDPEFCPSCGYLRASPGRPEWRHPLFDFVQPACGMPWHTAA